MAWGKPMGVAFVWVLAIGSPLPALASFHFMQIEQVIGGVQGDTSAQAIQLRMRSSFQNRLASARLRAWDAAGQNPVLIINFTTSVINHGAGVRVLVASANFANLTDPALVPDFTLTNPIPASYLAAGSLTFEDNFGSVYWRLSWGGASYTGSTTGLITNDSNGDFGPPFADALPVDGVEAVAFQGSATAGSSTNEADYALTGSAAVLTNNGGTSFTVIESVQIDLSCLNDFAGCMTGPDEAILPGCLGSDVNSDTGVDLLDFAEIQLVPGCAL